MSDARNASKRGGAGVDIARRTSAQEPANDLK